MALNDETDKFMLLNQASTSVLRTRSLINGGFIHSLLESKEGVNYNESVGGNHFINEAEKSLNEAKYQFKLFQLQPLQFKNENYDDLEVEFNKYQKNQVELIRLLRNNMQTEFIEQMKKNSRT